MHVSKTLTYRALSKYAKGKERRKKIDAIIWSEGSYPYAINKRAKKEKRLSKIAKFLKIPLIIGAISRDSWSIWKFSFCI